MRSIVFAVGMTLAGASVAHAQQSQSLASTDFVPQQVVVATPAPAAALRTADAPIGMTRAQAGVDANANAAAAPGAALVDNSTRNTLAIVGAVVIVIALLAFLM
jgi:hypothetical protein